MTQFKLVPVEPTREMLEAVLGPVKPQYENRLDLRQMIYRAMLAAAPSPWVSVGERLPEKGQPILVPREDHHPFAGKYSPLGDLHRCLDYALGKWWEFTHWMPLPTPPEKSE